MSRILDQAEYDSLPKIAAVDFDGTLAIVKNYRGTGVANRLVMDRVKRLQKEGWKLILWTCRDDENEDMELTSAVLFCAKHGLFFDAVNENIKEVQDLMEGDTRKIYANVYIDDKSIVDWDKILPLLLEERVV